MVFNMSIRPLRILAVAALFIAVPAHAASLARFKGTYQGTHDASGTFVIYSGSTTGPSKVRITLGQKNQAATIAISGSDQESGRHYDATIKLKKNGTATTDAVVPGVVDIAASGTWKLTNDGKKISVKLTADSQVGKITSSGTLQVSGSTLKIKSTGQLSSPFGSGRGHFDFTGKK
jgi:hypothetical protein